MFELILGSIILIVICLILFTIKITVEDAESENKIGVFFLLMLGLLVFFIASYFLGVWVLSNA